MLASLVIKLLVVGLIAGGLYLANRFPSVFGFFAWELGVVRKPGELRRDYQGRRARYWISVSVYGAMLNYIAYRLIDPSNWPWLPALLEFMLPALLAGAFLTGLIAFLWSCWHAKFDDD